MHPKERNSGVTQLLILSLDNISNKIGNSDSKAVNSAVNVVLEHKKLKALLPPLLTCSKLDLHIPDKKIHTQVISSIVVQEAPDQRGLLIRKLIPNQTMLSFTRETHTSS